MPLRFCVPVAVCLLRRAAVIEKILCAGVECAEAFADPPGILLFPAEEVLVAKAVESRRHEFATARNCAHRALALLGEAPAPIVRRERGAPQWPAGIVGSITHCAGYRAAAVARARDILRVNGTNADALGLTDPGASDEALIAAMIIDPILVNRPIVATPKGVALCRPVELVLGLL